MHKTNKNANRPGRAVPKKQPPGKSQTNQIWGAYIPDIMRSYPGTPVRGIIKNGPHGPMFVPDQDNAKHKRHPDVTNWITGTSYDLVIQKMRETADDAIKELRAGIARLERFIDDN